MLVAGESRSFTWTYQAGDTPGAVTIAVTASGRDPLTGETLTATPPDAAHITVLTPASLSEALAWSASPTSARAGQPITVTLTVANPEGAATANVTSLSPSVSPATDATCTTRAVRARSPSQRASAAFTWTTTAFGTTSSTPT
jgi:hypothetical protein